MSAHPSVYKSGYKRQKWKLLKARQKCKNRKTFRFRLISMIEVWFNWWRFLWPMTIYYMNILSVDLRVRLQKVSTLSIFLLLNFLFKITEHLIYNSLCPFVYPSFCFLFSIFCIFVFSFASYGCCHFCLNLKTMNNNLII